MILNSLTRAIAICSVYCIFTSTDLLSNDEVPTKSKKLKSLYEGKYKLKNKSIYIKIEYKKFRESNSLAVISKSNPIKKVKFKTSLKCQSFYSHRNNYTINDELFDFIQRQLKKNNICDKKLVLRGSEIKNSTIDHYIDVNFDENNYLNAYYVFQHYMDVIVTLYNDEKSYKITEYVIPKLYCNPKLGYSIESLVVKDGEKINLNLEYDELLKRKAKVSATEK